MTKQSFRDHIMTTSSARAPKWAATLSVLVVLAGYSPLFAEDWVPGKHMIKAVGKVMGTVRGISDGGDFGYDKDLSILAAYVAVGKSVSFNKPLVKGEEYIILGGGDDDIEDLDLEVYDKNRKKIAADTQTDAAPLVRFKAPETGTFTLKAISYKAKADGFVCVVILRNGGYDVPKTNLVDAFASLIGGCNIIDKNTKDKVSFHYKENQWALYGSVLDKGEETTIENVDLGSGTRMIIAAGDKNAKDIDLFVKTGKGKDLGSDTKADAFPIVTVNAFALSDAKLTYKNVESKGRSLVLMTVLQLNK